MLTESAGHSTARPATTGPDLRHLHISVQGVAQGVGFRPFIHGLAKKWDLRGTVKNQKGQVSIEVEGRPSHIEGFLKSLESRPPRLAKIEKISFEERSPAGFKGFTIEESQAAGEGDVFISPDAATCDACLREMYNPADRRFRYPFLNCVDCGPRFTITEDVPYDRSRTTMKDFVLCADCAREYHDPADRRFHAQPIACPRCGPQWFLWDKRGEPVNVTTDPLAAAVSALRAGSIVAVKGLGGYHLACDATSSRAVSALRSGKHRLERPLAVMVRNVRQALDLCHVSPYEVQALKSVERPIVLLKKRENSPVAREVNLSSPDLGVMLPYTPLHHLLMDEMKGTPLVMTSGNDSDQPIARGDDEAVERLSPMTDFFLTHNRPIHVRCDDSVLRINPLTQEVRFIRRSRGFAPGSIPLPVESSLPILATGGQLKNTFALTSGKQAVVSHHIGDLDDILNFETYKSEISKFERVYQLKPAVIAHDMHPDYLSTQYAARRAARDGLVLIPVQHHHAHVAGCMAEHALDERVIGVAFDGTGYGVDGNLWGGEFLLCDYGSFVRAAHLKYVPLVTGSAAIREPWRMALSHLTAAGLDTGVLKETAENEMEPPLFKGILESMNQNPPRWPLTSSMGRLFDAVAAILGIRQKISYEGQAAQELEWSVQGEYGSSSYNKGESYHFALLPSGPRIIVDPAPVLRALVQDRKDGVAASVIAARFHSSVAAMIARVCLKIRSETSINKVALSGGVFLNSRLERETAGLLRHENFEVYFPQKTPPNDGGLSLGQLVIAAARKRLRPCA